MVLNESTLGVYSLYKSLANLNLRFNSIQFSRFLFPPLVEQNTYINVITLRKKGHATKRNNVVTYKNSINYTSKGNGLHGCIT